MIKPEFGKTWETFDREVEECRLSTGDHSGVLPMTLEGCVVRVADTISFIGRDIEDAITIGLIKREDVPKECAEALGDNNRDIVNNLVIDVIENSYGKDHVALSEDTAGALKTLREFNDARIYNNPKIKAQSAKIERMFSMLYETFLEDLKKGNGESKVIKSYLNTFTPERRRAYIDGTPDAEIVRDFIAGMTDDYFNDTFGEIYLPQKSRL
jgi:dGTPase